MFVVSHGWMADDDAAKRNYGSWIDAMVAQGAAGDAPAIGPDYKPQVVAVHWPSLPWGDERPDPDPRTQPEQYTATVSGRYATRILGPRAVAPESAGYDPAAYDPAAVGGTQAAMATILASADDIAHDRRKRRSLLRGELADLPDLNSAYQQLFAAAGTSQPPLDPGDAIRQWTVPTQPEPAYPARKEPASPGILGEIAHDFERIWDDLVITLDHDVDKVRDLVLVVPRLVSFWKVKDRAHATGEGTVHQFLSRLQAAAPSARFHLMGHSFGTIVISSALVGPAGGRPLPRPASSALFAQGAMSLWAYAARDPYGTGQAGDYRAVYAAGQPLVSGPLVTTQSVHDLANRIFFPMAEQLGSPDTEAAARAAAAGTGAAVRAAPAGPASRFPQYGAVGTFGLQDSAAPTSAGKVHRAHLDRLPSQEFDLKPGVIFNAEANDVIRKMQPLEGAHSDICHAELAHLFWQAIAVGRA